MPASIAPSLDADLARRLTEVALRNVGTEYPYHLSHMVRDAADVRAPRELFPVFWGSYDWHSCVHMHWTLARCLRLDATAVDAAEGIEAHFDARLTSSAVAREIVYFTSPGRASFERPYGWGWLLKLATELGLLARERPRAQRWADALAPLARHLAERCIAYLARADHPVRAGSHGNSAFALVLAHDYALIHEHRALAQAIADRAASWFGADRRYPADYEPSGDDFLSPGLCEALLMARTLPACDFGDWWDAFAPVPATFATWLVPVPVSDAADPKIVHLHGLNLSRAWCWRALLPRLPVAHADPVRAAIDASLAASLPAATAGDYVGTHWLASFALLALTEPLAIASSLS
ncbi:MAG TPA: DUF2891 domain-containing protein [Burkholderiaceae bacterium]|nr:DUF2891 domain-containing protein [Burkholderiaceae bacterium]